MNQAISTIMRPKIHLVCILVLQVYIAKMFRIHHGCLKCIIHILFVSTLSESEAGRGT